LFLAQPYNTLFIVYYLRNIATAAYRMNIFLNRNKKYYFLLLSIACLAFNACQSSQSAKTPKAKPQPTFKSVWGIGYTEVHRTLASGLSFSDQGYQLIPSWRLSFPSDDSVNIYNPQRKLFVNAPVILDHDSVFNVAWAYLRLKKLSRDSIIFQILKVDNKVIENNKSVVYMVLYANDYIRNVLHKDPLHLTYTTRRDTDFIRKKALLARKDMHEAFSATQPAELISKSPLLTVERLDIPPEERLADEPDYMLPQFSIVIHNAYERFNYAFNALIDDQGNIQFVSNAIPLDTVFLNRYNKAIRGIINGYLKAYLRVKPGSTLGIPHSSRVVINVMGLE
jgi:hypothetical protein